LKKEMKEMKPKKLLGWASALCLSASVLQAQEANQVEELKKQLEQIQQNFEKTTGAQRRENEALKKQLEELRRRLSEVSAELQKQKAAPAVAPPAAPPPAAPAPPSTAAAPAAQAGWQPSQPIQLLGGQRNYLDLSFDGLFTGGWSTANDLDTLQFGDHDPKQRGFTIPNLETTFEGKVDPYFRGQANLVLKIDPQGETTFEAEEAYMETMALPWNLQLKAGQFFTEFGRINPTHPHTWDFVDAPLVHARFMGPDGLRNPGARLSWLAPTPFYSELFLAVQNSQGATAFSFRDNHEDELLFGRLHAQGPVKAFTDLLFAPRYAASFNLSDSQTLVAGASAALGPNGSGDNTDTQIYGADLFWKWKSPHHHGGFPFVSWQTEALLRRFKAGAFSNAGEDRNNNRAIDPGEFDLYGDGSVRSLPGETLTDWGLYSQIAYGFRKGWVAALRGDYVTSDAAEYERLYGRDPDRATRWRISPNLTWYLSEFSKIRLQYNFDHRSGIGPDHSVWVQMEFLLGTHAAHKF
jgi:hypothetical protein